MAGNHPQERGFSLVELMVAMTMGLIAIAGVFQIFNNTKQSNSTQEGMSLLYDNARYALYLLTEELMATGYDGGDGSVTQGIVTTDSAVDSDTLADTIDNSNGDQITISYDSATDCLGNNPGAEQNKIVQFSIVNAGLNWRCLYNGAVTAQTMVEGIENMQILYGEDTDGDLIANSYRSFGNVTNWNNIVSYRLALLVASVDDVAPTSDTNSYVLLNNPPITTTTNLLQRRRVFSRTIMIRNR
ncbi:MAG: PilW family protein [Gammaproteobacteria bacterium]|nr:PilW family protein [Gammaproteobacteria bacterium]